MNRQSDGESIKKVINKIRKEIPDVIIRSTVMVGFPGETVEDFEELCEFLKTIKFDKLGAFSYSKEEGTPAEKLKEQIHPQTKKSRYNKVMKIQQEISKSNLENKVGNEYEVLIENVSFDGKYYIGRSYMDVPDIDGVVFIKNIAKDKDMIGQFVKCKITEIQDYDLIGKFE
jgi:ribosomal protein S12 methylthiotransferase